MVMQYITSTKAPLGVKSSPSFVKSLLWGCSCPKNNGTKVASSSSAGLLALLQTHWPSSPLGLCLQLSAWNTLPACPHYLLPSGPYSKLTSGLWHPLPSYSKFTDPVPLSTFYLLSLPHFFSLTPVTKHAVYFTIYLICLSSFP